MPTCICLKEFATETGLKQHIRRKYCKGPPNDRNELECHICHGIFDTYIGVRQHLRLAHPIEYNKELEKESAPKNYAGRGWTTDQVLMMARKEVTYTGRFINNFIKTELFPDRSIESIKSKRRTDEYKDLVISLSANPPIDDIQEEVDNVAETIESVVEIVEESSLISDVVNNTPLPISTRYQDPIREFLLELKGSFEWTETEEILFEHVSDTHIKFKEDVRRILDVYVDTLVPTNNRRKKVYNKKPASTLNRDLFTRTERKINLYKTCQNLYKRNTRRLAECIIDDKPLDPQFGAQDIDEVHAYYREIFDPVQQRGNNQERRKTCEHIDVNSRERSCIENNNNNNTGPTIYAPLTCNDVSMTRSALKPTAAGLDGIGLADLHKIPTHRLVLLFNVMLLFGITPSPLKRHRTTLIPKGNVEDSSLNNYRPITVASLLIRLFHKILASRLLQVPISAKQRGFMRVDGTANNIITLESVIKTRRKMIKPYHLVFLDIRKAFDCVSHFSIIRALKRLNVDNRIIAYVTDNYQHSSTSIFLDGKSTPNITMSRGVKQGDPLSPVLFNFLMDELLCGLEDSNLGIDVGHNENVAAIAYADDLVLLAENIKNMQEIINQTNNFLAGIGLSVNTNKCAALSANVVPAKKKLYINTTPLFRIQRDPIVQMQPGQFFKYLGFKITCMGLQQTSISDVDLQFRRIRAAPLKPHQKLKLIKYYLIPRYISSLQNPRITLTLLKGIDRLFRKNIRIILHLPRSSADAFLHAPMRQGGLGIFSFRSSIPRILRDRLLSLKSNGDPLTRAICDQEFFKHLVGKLTKWSSGDIPITPSQWGIKLEGSFSGGGLIQGNHSGVSGAWVDGPPAAWSGQDFVKAVQLKSNLLPVKGVPSNPVEQRKCRAGCNRTESLSHVLQGCPATHWHRIRRHDRVVNVVKNISEKKGWITSVVNNIRCSDGVLKKPDLLLSKDDQLIVCDVTVPWEGPSGLGVAFNNKIQIYSTPTFIEKIKNTYPDKIITVTALVISARGIYYRGNTLDRLLNMTKSDVCKLINNTINGSTIIHSEFNKLTYVRAR